MSRFEKYLGGLPITVEGEKYVLDMRLKDKAKMISLQPKMKEGMTEEVVLEMGDIFRTVFYRTFLPYWDKHLDKSLENITPEQLIEQDNEKSALELFLTKNFENILTEVGIAMGWTTREELQKAIEKAGEKK